MLRPFPCSLWLAAASVVSFAAVAGETAPLARPDAGSDSAYTERLKEIRLIEIRYLRSGDAAEFEKGRQKILAMQDEAAIGPLVHVLYGTNARYRGLLLEALSAHAGRQSKTAQAYLQDIAVGDSSVAHRRRAVEGLKGWSGDRPTERLMAHLALDQVPVLRDRAAAALAALDEKRAVWLLVERLVSEDVRLVGADVSDAQVTLDIRAQMAGVPTFRQAVVTAAVPGGGIATATIDLPQVQIVDVATTIAMADRQVSPRYERVRTEHPEILAALKALTGKDFGYNQAAWQKWLQSAEAAKVVPPWEPVVFKTAEAQQSGT